MSNKEIQIATGLQEFKLNGVVSVFFNPTDAAFIEKVFKTFDELDKAQDNYSERLDKAKSLTEMFNFLSDLNKEMREKLFNLFDMDIVTPLIGNANVYALSEGMPIWANIMFAIIDEIDTSFDEQTKLSDAKIKKYTSKYTRDHKRKSTK